MSAAPETTAAVVAPVEEVAKVEETAAPVVEETPAAVEAAAPIEEAVITETVSSLSRSSPSVKPSTFGRSVTS